MTSATVSVWKDCGYTEGAYIVPSQSDTLPSPDFTFTLPSIPRDTLFSSFNVKHPYTDLYDCSYLRISYDFNNGNDIVLYGWIDNVGCMSDTSDSPNTTVSWHVDLWRTYLDKASFGAGTVTRRLPNNDDPPQNYPFKWSTVTDDKQSLVSISDSDIYWVFINMTFNKGISGTTTLCWPCNINSSNLRYKIPTTGADMTSAPSYLQTITGAFDELLGIDPTAIYGVWISPIPPAPYVIQTKDGSKVVSMSPWGYYSSDKGGAFQAQRADLFKPDFYPETMVTINAKTADYEQCIITDLDAQPALALPWGVQAMFSYYRIINADVSMYISFRLITKDSQTLDAATNGIECTIPLKTLPLTENAKSSYIYSGQQEYDRYQMEIARKQALVNSVTGGANSAVNNTIMSQIGSSKTEQQGRYMVNSEGKPVPTGNGLMKTTTTTKVGAPQAAIATFGISAGMGFIDYAAAGYFNDRTMDNTMYYMGMKTASLTLPSSGLDWTLHGRKPMIVKLRWDQYSIDQRENDLLMYGARVHETHDSCQDIIDAGGPLQINNLNVTGAIPVQAKNYFRRRFSDGVKIV